MKNKIVAALLAAFLGMFGIHKFYLEENGAGLIYLLFFWTGIPAIIAFFEFFFLLLMSDRAFDAVYNREIYNRAIAETSLKPSSQQTTATLIELKKLYDSGIITAEEYEEKRRKYLDAL